MSGVATVLVVDDQKELADGYASTLEGDYDVLTAYSGEEALEKIDASVDVILLDRRMPGLSGDEVLEQIHKDELGCRVVMVTAVDPDVGIVEMDFDEYLVKPVSNEQITKVVERMLARNTHDEQLQEIFALAAKLATLESKLDIHQLEESEEYTNLRRRFEELRRSVDVAGDDMYLDATSEKIQALLQEAN